jgi:hypothetical protein
MASTSSEKSGPSSIRGAVTCLIVLLLVAALIGSKYLGNPWYAVGRLAFYAWMLWLVVHQLRECIRLAKSPDHARQLKLIGIFLAMTVLGVVTHVGDILWSDKTDFIDVATDMWVYFALMTSLELTKSLLEVATTARMKASVGAEPRET